MPAILILLLAPLTGAEADWLQFNGNPQHDGNNKKEKVLTRHTVVRLAPVFQISLPDVVDGCPVYLKGVSVKTGKKDILYVTSKQGRIMAIDAHDGELIWTRDHPAGKCRINNGYSRCYTTASPVVDPNRKFVYTYGLDGYVHKHLTNNGEELKGNGWPALTTLKPSDEQGSSNLSIATDTYGTSFLYVAHAGYPGDKGNFQGHITAINLSTGRQQVFNANCSTIQEHLAPKTGPSCSARRTGIWSRAGVVYDKSLNRIFVSTGNGPFAPGRYHWGNSVLALRADGSGKAGKPLDSYTPANHAELSRRELDLGSSSPVILTSPAGCRIRHLGLIIGKDSLLRLLNLENLNGHGGPGRTGGEIGKPLPLPQKGQVLTTPVVWINPADGKTWVFISTKKGISAWSVTIDKSGIPSLKLKWRLKQGGTSPLMANNILYYASSHRVRALKPTTGRRLWSDTSIGSIHWQSPIVADGVLYIADDYGQLTAFRLNPASLKKISHFGLRNAN